MNNQSGRKLYNGFCIGACVSGVLSIVLRESEMLTLVLLALAVVLVIAAVMVQWKYGRCPRCGGHLPFRSGKLSRCPHCGEKI